MPLQHVAPRTGPAAVVALGLILAFASPSAARPPDGIPHVPTIGSSDVALEWNANAVAAVRTAVPAKFPAESLIYMSYVQAAVYDAATKIAGRYAPYHDFRADPAGAALDAAVITAAYDTLVAYLGDPEGSLTAKYDTALAAVPETGKAAGIAVGEAASADIVALRATDGRNAPTPVFGAVGPVVAGAWQVVPPATTAQTPWVAFMRPFTLQSASQFRVEPPPGLGSRRYARDFNEVKAYGAADSTVRTPYETATAWFWNTNVINQYNRALSDVATQHGMDALDTLRLLAMGNMVPADANIACFDSKYRYLFWRPSTAIRNADLDGAGATVADPSWTPVQSTPNHPEYPSAHGCVTSAFTQVLAHALHTQHIQLDIWGLPVGGSTLTAMRHFDTVEQVNRQIPDARVWIGFHFRNSVTAGLNLGRHVARWALGRYFRPVARADAAADG